LNTPAPRVKRKQGYLIPFSGSNNGQIKERGDKRQRRDAHILRVTDHKSNVNGWKTGTVVGDEATSYRPRRQHYDHVTCFIALHLFR